MQDEVSQPESTPEVHSVTELDAAYARAVALEPQPSRPGTGLRLRSWFGREIELTEGFVERDMLLAVRVLRWIRGRHWLVHASAAGVVCVAFIVSGILLLLPHQIAFSFASTKSCTFAPTILPGMYSADSRASFALMRPANLSVFGVGLFSSSICAQARTIPSADTVYGGTQYLHAFGWRIPVAVQIKTVAYPVARSAITTARALPLTVPLTFMLNAGDSVFDYAVTANGKMARCTNRSVDLACGLAPLQLAYDSSYTLHLVRIFHGSVAGTVLSIPVTTITAAGVTASSIGAGAVVYDSPQQLTLTTNKPIKSLGELTLQATSGGQAVTIDTSATFAGAALTVRFLSALPRRASVDLRIAQLTARDGSQLEQPYVLTFQTSGGPKVAGSNIGSYGISLRPKLNIFFDQPLQPGQPAAGIATLSVNGAAVATDVTISGNQLSLTLGSDLPRCANLTITTASSIISQYGFSGDSAWSYHSRTLCYTTFSIGTSVQGRAITAYQFGNGSNVVLYVAAMHGNESNTAALLSRWIDTLDASPGSIPAGRTIVVIPEINPDGVAANTRENAHHIDLNRNFPTNDWQTQVTEPLSNGSITDEGGPSPLSEPESQAIAGYIQAIHPRLVLTYHSRAGIVEPNGAGDADQLGQVYASKTGYTLTPVSAINNVFDYSTTGAMEDWMRDKLGWPALLVELWTSSSIEYYTNLPAMWAMAQVQ